MHDLNLIPEDYVQTQKLRVLLSAFLVVLALLLSGLGVARYILSDKLSRIENEISKYEYDKNTLHQQHQTLQKLSEEKNLLENKVAVLRTLRDGLPARQMFIVMNKVLDKSIWFNNWSFRRAGEFGDYDDQSGRPELKALLHGNQKSLAERAWKLSTHMEINGRTLDHTYLASFVNRLITQPEIEDVKVLRTSTIRQSETDAIDFNLAITVNNMNLL
ncbi:MAG: hypothetical protein GKR93_01400 [Gammaproteobacteria bacterium]|nr:hypothetical protein [Gammaproteobacteria bacterium]